MDHPEDNVVDLERRPNSDHSLLDSLLLDYEHCNERHRSQIRRFAHALAEMDPSPHLDAQILPFPTA